MSVGAIGPTYVLDKSAPAVGAIRQYRAVELTGDGTTVTEAGTAGAGVIGICQEEISADDAALGRVASIRILGVSYAVAGAAVAAGARVRTDNQGRLTALAATTANQEVVGIALNAAAAAGDPLAVLLTPAGSATTT
jgi:hypothetical protein